MEPIPGPQVVTHRGLEPAVDLVRGTAVRADVQPRPGQMGLQRADRWWTLTRREHDLMHLRRGPLRPLPLQSERELQHPGRRARHHDPRLGHQRLKPVLTVRADPVIQRRATNPNKSPVRAEMLSLSKRADQPAPLSL